MSTHLDIVLCQDCVRLPDYVGGWVVSDALNCVDGLDCCECGDSDIFYGYLLTPIKGGV